MIDDIITTVIILFDSELSNQKMNCTYVALFFIGKQYLLLIIENVFFKYLL